MGGFLRRIFGPGHATAGAADVKEGHRCRSGEICRAAGVYVFDGYVSEPTPSPRPLPRDRTITLHPGDRFPPIRLYVEDCWWKLAEKRAV